MVELDLHIESAIGCHCDWAQGYSVRVNHSSSLDIN